MKRKIKVSTKVNPSKVRLVDHDYFKIGVQILPILLTCLAVYQTNNSLLLAEKSAGQAFELQRNEMIHNNRQDEINSELDSIKNKMQIQLTQEQIQALKKQADEYSKSVKNVIVSQRPLLDIEKIGLHNISNIDSLICTFNVINRGARPAIVKNIDMYFIDNEFKIYDNINYKVNTLLIDDKVLFMKIHSTFEDKMYYLIPKSLIHTWENFYICIIIEYEDDFIDKRMLKKSEPILHKWIKKAEKDWLYQIEGEDAYLPFELCSGIEEEKLIASVNKYRIAGLRK